MNNLNPAISVVICTYNREKFILSALRSFIHQSIDKDLYELIIVNNNCTDSTHEICQKFIQKHPQLPIQYVIEKQQGLSFARNRGIKESKSSIITYVDDDAILSEQFIQTVLQFMQSDYQPDGCGGKIIPKYETAEPKWMSPYLEGLVTKLDYGNTISKFPPNRFPAGCNMTYKKALLEKVGGFDPSLKWRADDKYIYLQIAKYTNAIYYLPDAWLFHIIDDVRTSYASFKKICVRTGNEERIRIKKIGTFAFIMKIIEYLIKFLGSIILAVPYVFKGQLSKSKYLILYRFFALKGLLTNKIE